MHNLYDKNLQLFSISKTTIADDVIQIENLADQKLDTLLTEKYASKLREDVELIEGVYEPFEMDLYREGYLAPVFFGSAIYNFGVQELLDTFAEGFSAPPQARETSERRIQPEENKFSGFIFKIHANLDPNHRDRIAFCRVCSGTFERNKFYLHTRLEKKIKFSNPTSFMANDKSVIDEAYPGDVVGLYDTGNFKIGDTLTEGSSFISREYRVSPLKFLRNW